jgi:hypothetical protein
VRILKLVAGVVLVLLPIALAAAGEPEGSLELEIESNPPIQFGGSARVRGEFWNQFGFGFPANDNDSYLLERIQIHADWQVSEAFRFYVEGIHAGVDSRELPGGARAVDADDADVLNAFVEIRPFDSAPELRAGRQQFNLGAQRLVSPLPWLNSYNKWDGARLSGDLGDDLTYKAFWGLFAQVDKRDFNEPDEDNALWGFYATWREKLDLYYIGRDLESATIDRQRHTLGARWFGDGPEIGGLKIDFDLEGAYQFGLENGADVSAWMFGGETGFSAGKLRAFIGFDAGSGDSDPADGEVNTFDQMLPLAHAYLGQADLFGRQNILSPNAGLTIKPTERLKLRSVFHAFWRFEENDALYNAGGRPFLPADPGGNRFLGTEIDFSATYQICPEAVLQIGHAHVFTRDSFGEDIDFTYVSLTTTFGSWLFRDFRGNYLTERDLTLRRKT